MRTRRRCRAASSPIRVVQDGTRWTRRSTSRSASSSTWSTGCARHGPAALRQPALRQRGRCAPVHHRRHDQPLVADGASPSRRRTGALPDSGTLPRRRPAVRRSRGISSLNPTVVHAMESDAVSFQVVDRTQGEGVRGRTGRATCPASCDRCSPWTIEDGHGATLPADSPPTFVESS